MPKHSFHVDRLLEQRHVSGESAAGPLPSIHRLFLRDYLTCSTVKEKMRAPKMNPLSAYLFVPGFT